MKIIEKYNLTPENIDRIVEMAWEDRTPFEAIEVQFGLKEAEVIALMKFEMHPRNWRKWRARVQGRATKHRKLYENIQLDSGDFSVPFKSRMQRPIGNRIAKKKY